MVTDMPRSPGPYSKSVISGTLDGRTKEARMLRETCNDLFKQLGGKSQLEPTQIMLVERAAILRVRCAVFDAKFISGNWTAEDDRVYGWINNSLSRLLRQLGLPWQKPTRTEAEGLSEYHALAADIEAGKAAEIGNVADLAEQPIRRRRLDQDAAA
jgi:hypothetical protein